MNKSIRRVSVVAGILFLALLLNITGSYLFRTTELLNSPYNRRVQEAQFGQPRGAILVGNTAIAQTVPSDGRFDYQRTYTDPQLYSAMTGYYSFLYGRSGLEQQYNAELTGTASSQGLDQVIEAVTGQQPEGASIQTTINAKAQQAAWDALAGRKGAVVALDYTTGAILTYVSSPSLDVSQLAGDDMDAVQAAWGAIDADPANPDSDRAGNEIYPPGSTFKLVVASAALEKGWDINALIEAPTKLRLPGTETDLPNAAACGGTQITLEQALKVSCNTAFANLGMTVGWDAIHDQAEAFGFNSTFDSDVHSSAAQVPDKGIDQAQTALSSIGQFDVAATPLQMAVVTSTIANNGARMEPYFVSEIRDSDLSVLSTHEPKQLNQAISANTAATLQQMMIATVNSGGASRAAVPGVVIGGKTGTAESDPTRPNYLWFTGFAQDPHVAITVFLEDAEAPSTEMFASTFAAPLFKQIMEAFL